jgi:hypothetical protein
MSSVEIFLLQKSHAICVLQVVFIGWPIDIGYNFTAPWSRLPFGAIIAPRTIPATAIISALGVIFTLLNR